jgi:hypothetical protein
MVRNRTLYPSPTLGTGDLLRREDLPEGSHLLGPKDVQRSQSRVSQGFGSRAHVFHTADFVDTPEKAQDEPEAHQAECGAECNDRDKLHHRAYLSID